MTNLAAGGYLHGNLGHLEPQKKYYQAWFIVASEATWQGRE